MQVALRANVAAALIPAARRIGFDRARSRDGHGLFLDRRIEPRSGAHVIDGFFGFLEALGIGERVLRWDLPVPPAARAFAERQLAGDAPWLAINPRTSARVNNWRNWSAERYAAVADHAAERHGLRVVLTGGPAPAEREMADAIRARVRHDVLDLVGRTSPKQLLAVLGRARVAVAPDTGPAHIATAAGTPVIGLYATSNPHRTGPARWRDWTVDRYPEAVRAAYGRDVDALRWGKRVRDPQAMQRITVAEVTHRLDGLLFDRGGRRGSLSPRPGDRIAARPRPREPDPKGDDAMSDTQDLNRLILEQMADAMVFADPAGVMRQWNAGAEALFGFSREEAIGQSLDLIIPEHLREAHWTAYYRALEEGETKYGRQPLFTRTAHKDGTTFYVDMGLAVVIGDDGTVQGAVALLRDATERRNREREMRKRIAELEAGHD